MWSNLLKRLLFIDLIFSDSTFILHRNLPTIGHWIGHFSVNSTNKYSTIDLEMKLDTRTRTKPV